MGRRSKAEKAIEAAEDWDDAEGRFLVIYDFVGGNPFKFYRNLKKLFERYGGALIQRSVAEVGSLRAAMAIEILARSYGARVMRVRVCEE